MLPIDPLHQPASGIHPAALGFRIRAASARIAAICKMFGGHDPASSPRLAELATERRLLRTIVGEAKRVLGITPRKLKDPKDQAQLRKLRFLRREIADRTAGTMFNAARLDGAGEHHQARIHRVSTIFFGEQICREYSIDVELLAHCDAPAFGPTKPAADAAGDIGPTPVEA